MAPRGRKKMPGLMREDAARDAMREYGFEERVINETIKELVELYGEDAWKLIEDGGYDALLTRCLERQQEQANKLAEEEQEDTDQEEENEHEQQVENRRDHVGSNSTSFVGCGAETGTQTCQTDALSIPSEAVMDSSPAAFQSGETSPDYAHHFVGGTRSSHCGWLSSEGEEEETDPEEDSDGDDDDDDEIIQLTPEPLCEELEELVREVRGQKKRKRPTRWDN